MSNLQEQPGFYGKLPILGDFVSRRLPADFIQVWDAWLQRSLTASRENLGDTWLDIYLTSPIWRFILSPGICGATSWMGVLMPSVDRVGRYFPLTLATAIKQEKSLGGLLASATNWFEKLEHLALSALEDGFDLDSFDECLQKELFLSPPSNDSEAIANTARAKAQDPNAQNPIAMHIAMNDLSQLPEALAHLGSALLSRVLSTYSLWSTNGSERVQPCLLAYQGLPPEAAFTELISGQWQYTERQGKGASFLSASTLPRPGDVIKVQHALRPPHNARQYHSAALTSVGKIRKINEDAFLDRPSAGIWVVADGMGGHWAGEVASKAVVDALQALPDVNDLEESLSMVSACLRTVNTKLIGISDGKGDGRTMGSTVVTMLAREDQGAAIWVGDSRLYRLRGEVLTQLTEDHSLLVELAKHEIATGIKETENVNTNVITRAVGAQADLAVDAVTFEIEPDDIFLLCSDGLMKEVLDEEIGSILRWHENVGSARALVELTLERGARDNVTVIVVWSAPMPSLPRPNHP
jgi:type VI secretion system protein ImpM